MVYDCWFRDRIHNSWSVRKKNMFLFHLLLGKTGSWNYGTSLSRILDLELSPSFFAWYHIMVRYWFVVSQLIIFKNSAHNGNFAHHQSVKKKKAIEKCLENEIYLESIQKSLRIYSIFITLEPFNPQFWPNISCLLRWYSPLPNCRGVELLGRVGHFLTFCSLNIPGLLLAALADGQ